MASQISLKMNKFLTFDSNSTSDMIHIRCAKNAIPWSTCPFVKASDLPWFELTSKLIYIDRSIRVCEICMPQVTEDSSHFAIAVPLAQFIHPHPHNFLAVNRPLGGVDSIGSLGLIRLVWVDLKEGHSRESLVLFAWCEQTFTKGGFQEKPFLIYLVWTDL